VLVNGLNPATGLDLPELPSPARRYRWTPARLRTLAALAVLIAFATAAVVSSAAGDLRTGMRRIGGRAAPQALVAADLRTTLRGLDAALATALDTGAPLDARQRAVARFDSALLQANAALQRLASTTAGDPAARRELNTVVDALTRYQVLAGQLMLLGAPESKREREPVRERLRQATGLMRTNLLPAAQRLADAGVRELDRTHRERRDGMAVARDTVAGLGVALLIVLAALQLTLARRHRRLINPPLVLVTALACVLIGASVQMLDLQRERLGTAGAAAPARADALDDLEEIRALERWDVMPPLCAAVLAGLVLAGVRPRLAEFR
jgi:hypothetical protein